MAFAYVFRYKYSFFCIMTRGTITRIRCVFFLPDPGGIR
nr:MAG TPA: hypothetical protein [Caudoviricetes sp.]